MIAHMEDERPQPPANYQPSFIHDTIHIFETHNPGSPKKCVQHMKSVSHNMCFFLQYHWIIWIDSNHFRNKKNKATLG